MYEMYKILSNLKEEKLNELKDDTEITQFHNMFLDFKDDLLQNCTPLAKFWLTYIEICILVLVVVTFKRYGSIRFCI